MKVVLLLVLVTLLGAAMLIVGIAGAAGAFEGDEDSSSSARFEIDERKDCSRLDPRLTLFNSWETSVGDSGSLRIVVSCTDGEIEASVFGSGLMTEDGRVLALWAWRTRKDAQLVESYSQDAGDDGVVFFEGTLPSDLPRYRKLVITSENPGDDPDEPGEILTQSVIE
jgi:hypothetical protein